MSVTPYAGLAVLTGEDAGKQFQGRRRVGGYWEMGCGTALSLRWAAQIDPLSEASWSLRGIPGPYPLHAPKVPTPPSTSLHCRCRGLGGEGSALDPQQSLGSGARDVKS